MRGARALKGMQEVFLSLLGYRAGLCYRIRMPGARWRTYVQIRCRVV